MKVVHALRPDSLQGRLLLLVLAVLLAGSCLGLALSYRKALHEADELFDAQLAQTAETLLAISDRHHPHDREENEHTRHPPPEHHHLWQPSHPYQQKLLFQLWRRVDGQLRLQLRSAIAPVEALPAREKEFLSVDWQGGRWRFFAQTDLDHDTQVMVGQDLAIREELAQQLAWRNLAPLALGLPLLAAILLLAIRRGLAPLSTLARELDQRAASRLEPIQLPQPPEELRSVQTALNDLLARLGTALEYERRFTADAAHELRTPLAALQAQIHVADRTPDPDERRRALDQCRRGLTRMTHLVSQLLTLARLDARDASRPTSLLDLSGVAGRVCTEYGPQAIHRGINLELIADHPCLIPGQADWLAILLGNLINNALGVVTTGGWVKVTVQPAGDADVARLTVADNGPGVADSDLRLLGQRFQRLGDTAREGVGLGLSIAQRIAAIHGGRLQFSRTAESGGLTVTLELPAG